MIHLLKDIDYDKILNKPMIHEKPCPEGENCTSCAYMDGYIDSCTDHQALGVEIDVEELHKELFEKYKKVSGYNIIPSKFNSKLTAIFDAQVKSIATNPKILKLVRIRKSIKLYKIGWVMGEAGEDKMDVCDECIKILREWGLNKRGNKINVNIK